MATIRCPICGDETPEGRFCEHCGASLLSAVTQIPTPTTGAVPPKPPGKKRSTGETILMIIGAVVLFFIFIAIIAAFVFGMAASTTTTDGGIKPTVTTTSKYTYYPTVATTRATVTPTSRYAPDSYSKTIANGAYWYYYIPLKTGDRIVATIKTDGSPVDLMVMDSTDFKNYETAVASPPGRWNAWNDLNINSDQYDFTAPSSDTYYFVVDNTDSPTNGAYAKSSVNIAATFYRY